MFHNEEKKVSYNQKSLQQIATNKEQFNNPQNSYK